VERRLGGPRARHRRQPTDIRSLPDRPGDSPREQRGRGYAGATVAAVSRRLLDEDARVCLFTDQANPVSNALYERLGFRPVVDMANLVIG
jgi:RimJ/RimL family protein N-acetyltransferase